MLHSEEVEFMSVSATGIRHCKHPKGYRTESRAFGLEGHDVFFEGTNLGHTMLLDNAKVIIRQHYNNASKTPVVETDKKSL